MTSRFGDDPLDHMARRARRRRWQALGDALEEREARGHDAFEAALLFARELALPESRTILAKGIETAIQTLEARRTAGAGDVEQDLGALRVLRRRLELATASPGAGQGNEDHR